MDTAGALTNGSQHSQKCGYDPARGRTFIYGIDTETRTDLRCLLLRVTR